MLLTRIVVVAIAGALGAGLANRGMVFFHDATRAVLAETIGCRVPRPEFLRLAWGSSLGLIVCFGIPYSLASAIVLSHALWLGTDVIGAWFPGACDANAGAAGKNTLGLLGAVGAGAVYGSLLAAALSGLTLLMAHLPVDFFTPMAQLRGPVILTLSLAPALAVAYQYGLKQGLVGFVIVLVGRQVAGALGLPSPDTWAFVLGMAVLAVLAVREARCEPPPEEAWEANAEQAARIRGFLPWIAVLGAVYALASNLGIVMEGPQALLAWAQGDRLAAAGFTVARALSLMPLRTMSILSTGVFSMEVLGFAPTAGVLAPNALVAAVAGAVVMTAEALSLGLVARFFGRFPCMLKAANSLRTAMTKLLEVASLYGGLTAANGLSPGFGFFAACGLYLLNEVAGTPVLRVAMGPTAIILVGIVLNVLRIFRLA